MLSPVESSFDIEARANLDSISQESCFTLFTGVEDGTPITIRSRFVGERLNLKTLETAAPLASNPLLVRAGQDGCAVLFRYGVVVLF